MTERLLVAGAGIYLLRWDNTHSMMRGKQLTYKVRRAAAHRPRGGQVLVYRVCCVDLGT